MKVSIVTVCLNSQDTIEQTINSVLSQTYENIEYIIVDGGSTDGTLGIIEKYRGSIANVISEQDKGLYDAMNKGIDLASGEIIGFLNSDDWYEENTIQNIIEQYNIQNYPDVLFGNIYVHDTDGKQIKVRKPYGIKLFPFFISIYQPASFITLKIMKDYHFDIQYKVAADFDIWRKLIHSGFNFSYIDQEFTHFQLGGESTKKSNQGYFEEIKSIFNIHGLVIGTPIAIVNIWGKFFFHSIEQIQELIYKIKYNLVY